MDIFYALIKHTCTYHILQTILGGHWRHFWGQTLDPLGSLINPQNSASVLFRSSPLPPLLHIYKAQSCHVSTLLTNDQWLISNKSNTQFTLRPSFSQANYTSPGSLQTEVQVLPMLCAVAKSFFAQVVPHQVSANPKLPLLWNFVLMRLTVSLVWESTIQTFSEHENRDHLSTCHNAQPLVDVWNVRLSWTPISLSHLSTSYILHPVSSPT